MILITQSAREVEQIMNNYVGIVRSTLRLKRAMSRLEILFRETEDLYERSVVSRQICELRNIINVSYLIIKAMLERLNPAMEEAAASLGAGRFHLFRTITLPLLVPGIAGSFLLLFVESLADLGNPLFIAGNRTVLSAQIFLAVIGEYNYQKASALALVLIIPTLVIFLVQRYYVNRKVYISVTGKPAGAQILEKDPLIRWIVITITYIIIAFIILLYATIVYGSFASSWGVDFTPTLRHWEMTVTRGIEAILDTTFLSAFATPIAALTGMVIAFLVVRKRFSGKDTLDFVSNLGGAVPGTILGIGYILAFIQAPWYSVLLIFVLLAAYLATQATATWPVQILLVLGGALRRLLFGRRGQRFLVGLDQLVNNTHVATSYW